VPQIVLGGTVVDLRHRIDVLDAVRDKLTCSEPGPPLAIGSANLDHLHHFGRGRPGAGTIRSGDVEWLMLLDGSPLVRRAERLTGRVWPALAGSDLLPPLLSVAEEARTPVGFLGGTPALHERLEPVLQELFPRLAVAGGWAPDRADLDSPDLAGAVREAGPALLVVGLGKPRQESWIERYAAASGARVLLGFGAAADFLAGTARRAPAWARQHRLEWLYRLAREPRRLARRYCIQGPPALWRLWTASEVSR